MKQKSIKDVDLTHSRPAAPTSSEPRETLFHLAAQSARNVLLAADFTGWDHAPIKMVKAIGGIWHAKVRLPPGKYRYRFLIDHGTSGKADCVLPFGTLSGVVEVSG
jgi:1,4-alpha-glucan branching enzyme